MGPKEKGKTNEGTRQFSPRAASFGTLRGEIIAVDDVDFSRVFSTVIRITSYIFYRVYRGR